MGLDGKHVVITGASRGIGLAIARGFAAAGARLHLIADEAAVHEAAAGLGATSAALDITDAPAVTAHFAALPATDVLINNAGLERMTPLAEAGADTIAIFRRVMDINVAGTFIVTAAALPRIPRGGRIIVTASIWGRVGEPLFSAYVASKHATIGLVKTWARELGPRGVTVNGVAPGWVRTEGSMRSLAAMATRLGRTEADMMDDILAGQALSGLMEPDDSAGPYLYLASDLAANVTGQTLGVDRGEVPW